MAEFDFGPWTVGEYQNIQHRLVPPAHGYPIKGEFGNVGWVIGSEEEARLIAAAPELLEALKWIRSHLPAFMGTTEWDKRLRQADEALTKAGICLDCEYNPGLCDTHDIAKARGES